MRFRVVKIGSGEQKDMDTPYYLQYKTLFGWKFICGYHRGAPGCYNYQYENAANPFALVEYGIPEVLEEKINPTLGRFDYLAAIMRKPLRKPSPITEVYDTAVIEKALKKYNRTDITKPYPSIKVLAQS